MRQIGMVIDLNKCIGCQTCTMACKTQWTIGDGRDYMYWNHVETMPGKGYPKGYMDMSSGFDAKGKVIVGDLPSKADYGGDFEFNYAAFMEGKDKVLAPTKNPTWGPNWDEEVGGGEYPNNYYFYLPRLCNHCSNPACVAACDVKAIRKRDEDGIVVIDLEKCEGHKRCIKACPYKKPYFNPTRVNPIEKGVGQSEKCISCFPRLEKGIASACVRQCVGRARFQSYMDDVDGPVYKLVKKWKVALPLMPEKGTKPNVFYVPPLSSPKFDKNGKPTDEPRIPLAYLKKLFGPEVEGALKTLKAEIDKKSKTQATELMDILIAYKHKDMMKLT